MDTLRNRVFGALAIRRAVGVSILSALLAAWGYIERDNLYEQGSYQSSVERWWTLVFEAGTYLAVAALAFLAMALLLGRPDSPATKNAAPPVSGREVDWYSA